MAGVTTFGDLHKHFTVSSLLVFCLRKDAVVELLLTAYHQVTLEDEAYSAVTPGAAC